MVNLVFSSSNSVFIGVGLVVTEQKCWANEQYARREFLEISNIPESVSDKALEDKIQGVLSRIDAKVVTENIELCHCLKGKGS